MIKFSYGYAQNLSRQRDLLMKVYNTAMPVKTGKQLKKVLERVGFAAQNVDEEQRKLQVAALKEACVLDENGEPKHDAQGEFEFKSDEARADANKQVMVGLGPVLKKEVELNLEPLNFDETGLQLTLAEMDLLAPILASDEKTGA